jgi:hypothetical protein
MITYDKWTKSTRSTNTNTCVEFKRRTSDTTAVKDSKQTAGPRITFSNTALSAFINASAAGDLGPTV